MVSMQNTDIKLSWLNTDGTEMKDTEDTEINHTEDTEIRRLNGIGKIEYSEYPFSELTHKIISCAIEVHKSLGPGFVESAYENALVFQLTKNGLKYERQKQIDIFYDNCKIGRHRLDLVVEEKIIVELKVVKNFCTDDTKRMLSYIKAAGLKVGLLINFAKAKIEIKRLIL